jgi:hypothetical protein
MILLPSLSNALCLENCRQETARISNFSGFENENTSSPHQQRNIRTGDVKNTVFGDMNIRVGHERVDVRTESNSNNNTIDANINSTIILGDMVK